MCTHNPEIQTNTGSSTMFNLGQMLDVLSVPSGQCLINGSSIQRQAIPQGACNSTDLHEAAESVTPEREPPQNYGPESDSREHHQCSVVAHLDTLKQHLGQQGSYKSEQHAAHSNAQEVQIQVHVIKANWAQMQGAATIDGSGGTAEPPKDLPSHRI